MIHYDKKSHFVFTFNTNPPTPHPYGGGRISLRSTGYFSEANNTHG